MSEENTHIEGESTIEDHGDYEVTKGIDISKKSTPRKPRKKKNTVKVICVRRFGVEDKAEEGGVKMVSPGEEIDIDIELARKFQMKGIIMVKI